jgi:hypothetical protein
VSLSNGNGLTIEEDTSFMHPGLEPVPAAPTVTLDDFEPPPISQDPGSMITKPKAKAPEVRKPKPSEWVRVHPDSSLYTRPYPLLVISKDNRDELYFVRRDMVEDLRPRLRDFYLFPSITRSGSLFLWPVRTYAGANEWLTSAREAAVRAAEVWIMLERGARCYEPVESDKLPPPTWPEWSLKEWFLRTFESRLINSPDHQVLREFRGEC